jgi:hypothetical protein
MKKLSFAIFGLICLLSCGNKSRTDLILGKWQFDSMEEKDGNHGPQEREQLQERNKGVTAEFLKDGRFISTKENSGQSEARDEGTYKLLDGGKYIVTKMSASDREDTVRVIDVNEKTMKVETPDKDIITLKKIQ